MLKRILDFSTQRAKLALLVTLLLAACSEDTSVVSKDSGLSEAELDSFELLNPELSASVKQIGIAYIEQIGTDLAQVASQIEEFQSSILSFIDVPSSQNLKDSKQAWLDTHSAYELTALHRHFAMQLFEERDSLELLQLQYQINHWPIVPGYIDYVDAYPDSGIVHDINVNLDSASLREQHGLFDVAEVTLGFHVIEFLLWGSNNDAQMREATDYLAIQDLDPELSESGYTLEQLSNNRRRQLLTLVTEALLQDFRSLQDLWLTKERTLRQRIELISGTELIVVLTDSMSAMLTEELLLRSLYPMLNGEFVESNQSRFSQSTQKAVSSQLSGLERLLLELPAASGATLDLVFSAISDEFSEFFYQNFDASKSCLVLLYSNLPTAAVNPSNEQETEVVECINLLTNMINYNDRLKFDLIN